MGESIITSRPDVFFGKAIKSFIESSPANNEQILSKPNAIPPWGGVPNLNASNKKPNWFLASSLEKPRTSKIVSWSFLSWILIDPPPISTPLITKS